MNKVVEEFGQLVLKTKNRQLFKIFIVIQDMSEEEAKEYINENCSVIMFMKDLLNNRVQVKGR